MGDAGTAGGRFDHAIRRRNALAALSAAAELPVLQLDRALELVLLLRETRDEKFPRAASRWLQRWVTETNGATVDDIRDLAQALVHIDDATALASLQAVFRTRGQQRLERAVQAWEI